MNTHDPQQSDYFMMNTYDPQHLLMCEKEDLVLYIQELRDDYDRNSKDHKWVYVKHMNDIEQIQKENEELTTKLEVYKHKIAVQDSLK